MQDFADKFRTLIGDMSKDIPDKFILEGFNWGANQLPLEPKLSKLFSRHYHSTLDANGHYKWSLNRDFRNIIDIPMLNFYTSTGGEPCKLKLCHKDVEDFYSKHGLIDLKEKGTPCEYTIEREDDELNLVIDRPSNIPIIIDYIAYGFPKPVTSMEEEVNISSIAEGLLLSAMREVYYYEAEDGAFAGQILDRLDNKQVLEAKQALNKRFGSDAPTILGEM